MTHDQWMQEHSRLVAELAELNGKRDELKRHADYIPGPVLQKRHFLFDRLEAGLLDDLAALVELDRSGVVS